MNIYESIRNYSNDKKKLTESFNPETVLKRISHYKEFDKHVLNSWYGWSVEDSEAKAKEASLKDPNDVYYVQYNDLMNSSSDYRYVNGVKYNINDGGFHWVNGLPKFHTDADWIAVRDGGKTWEEIDALKESADISRDLAIEPGSDEEAQLNSLYEEKKINWTDLGGSDQTAVEHFLSNYGKDFTGKSWNDVESEIRSACHEIGYANEELIDNGNWLDGDMDPEPNERLVGDYIYYNYFLPSLKKNETEEPTGTSKFIEVSKKSVKDSDGFMTDYTLYHDTETGKYVTVFGDQDIYKPEDGDFDMEFETAEEANEWFHSYTGFTESEEADWKVFDNYYNKLALPVPGEAQLYGADLSDLCDYVEKQQGLHNKREALNYIYEKKLPKSYFPKEYFTDAEDFKETPKSVASLKSLLEQLADKDFYHNMKDHWTHEDFEIDDRNNKEIQKVIDQLKEQGIETKYRMGYPIEYSDEIAKEAEEDKLSNEEYFKLHEDEINELPDKEEFLKMESYNADGTEHHDAFSVTNDGITEEPHESLWVYVSKHGIGPGTVPSDINISNVYDVPNTMKTIFCSNRELTKDELSKYELSLFDGKSDPELLKALFSAK